MKTTQIITIILSLLFFSSCNVVSIIGAETELDPSTFNTGKKYFKVAGVCNTSSSSQICIYDSKGAFIGKSAIGGSQAYNANVQQNYSFNGYVYFSADDGTNGSELWRMSFSDGSFELIQDLNTGIANGLPQYLTSDGSNLYYIASDGSAVAQLCTYTGIGTPSCVGISSGGGIGSVYDLEYINGNLYICVNGSLKFITATTGTETAVGGGGFCTYNMNHDGKFIYASNGTGIEFYDTSTNTGTFVEIGSTNAVEGGESGYIYYTDFTDLFIYDLQNSTSNTFITGYSKNSERYSRTGDGKIFLTMSDGSMDQIISTSPGSTTYNTETTFTTTQNSFLQTVSIRDFYIVGRRIIAAVEAPIGVTGLWVVDLFDGNTYKISGTETLDPYKPISVQY